MDHHTGPWRHPKRAVAPRRTLAPAIMLVTALCVAMAAAAGAVTISKGIANLAHFNVNHGVDQ